MRLISCYIENFGGLSQYERTFQPDLTVANSPRARVSSPRGNTPSGQERVKGDSHSVCITTTASSTPSGGG